MNDYDDRQYPSISCISRKDVTNMRFVICYFIKFRCTQYSCNCVEFSKAILLKLI